MYACQFSGSDDDLHVNEYRVQADAVPECGPGARDSTEVSKVPMSQGPRVTIGDWLCRYLYY